ncbi:hypothetical protein VOLCADRAFT_101549, partial [Volvox carteri f. nagariensis]
MSVAAAAAAAAATAPGGAAGARSSTTNPMPTGRGSAGVGGGASAKVGAGGSSAPATTSPMYDDVYGGGGMGVDVNALLDGGSSDDDQLNPAALLDSPRSSRRLSSRAPSVKPSHAKLKPPRFLNRCSVR